MILGCFQSSDTRECVGSNPTLAYCQYAESVGVGVSYNCRAGASGRTLAINSWILLKYHSVHFTVPLSYLSSWIFRYLVAFGI